MQTILARPHGARGADAHVNTRRIVNERGRPAIRQFRGPAYRLLETDEFGAMQRPRLMLDRRRRETAKEPGSNLDIPAQAPVEDSLGQGFAESHLLDVA